MYNSEREYGGKRCGCVSRLGFYLPIFTHRFNASVIIAGDEALRAAQENQGGDL